MVAADSGLFLPAIFYKQLSLIYESYNLIQISVMKYLSALLLALFLSLNGCKSDREISPTDVWSEGCAVFTSSEDGYKLSGLCCEYLVIPKIKLKSNNSFTASAYYYSYTGAGFSDVPVTVKGKLSKDEKTLDLSYEINGATKSYSLKAGATMVYCSCSCD